MQTAMPPSAAGKKWRSHKKDQARSWSDWTMTWGPALEKARAEAMAVAETNQPKGKGYNTAMSGLLEEYDLADMEAVERKSMLDIMANLSAVEEWRAKQPNYSRLDHPTGIWRAYQADLKKTKDAEWEPGEKQLSPVKQRDAIIIKLNEENAALKAHVEELEAARDTTTKPVTTAVEATDDDIAVFRNAYAKHFAKMMTGFKTLKTRKRAQEAELALFQEVYLETSRSEDASTKTNSKKSPADTKPAGSTVEQPKGKPALKWLYDGKSAYLTGITYDGDLKAEFPGGEYTAWGFQEGNTFGGYNVVCGTGRKLKRGYKKQRDIGQVQTADEAKALAEADYAKA